MSSNFQDQHRFVCSEVPLSRITEIDHIILFGMVFGTLKMFRLNTAFIKTRIGINLVAF